MDRLSPRGATTRDLREQGKCKGQKRLAVLTSHPIQYYAPLFRELARRVDLHVYFAHKATSQQQANAGFGIPFEWDVDLIGGYANDFLTNVSSTPGTDHFSGCDTPEVGCRLREGRFDALLIMGWHLKSFLQALCWAKRIRLPVLVRGDSHLHIPRSWIKRACKALLYPPFLRQYDAALYVGQRSRQYYESYGYPSSRLFFSPHCIDATWFAARASGQARAKLRTKLGIPTQTKVALLAGKLVSLKRPLDLIAAIAIIRADGSDVEILVAGDGNLKEEIKLAARSASVPIHLLGFCNQQDMPAAYAASDVLVLPSEHETWGLVANEALACNRPIIISDACGCAPDLASDGWVGRTYQRGNVHDLAAAIKMTFADPPSQEAISALSKKFSITAAADGIVTGIEYCCSA